MPDSRFFGYDCADAPRRSGVVIQVDASGQPCRAFGQFCTNTSRSGVLGPGLCLYFQDAATLSMKCRPEAGSLLDGTAGDGTTADFPLHVRAYLMKFPGAGSVVWAPDKAVGQGDSGTVGPTESIDLDTARFSHDLDGFEDVIDITTLSITIAGDHSADVLPGDACYVSSGAGAQGITVVESVTVVSGPATEILFEKWFPLTPTPESSTLVFGPWSIHRLEYEWPALDVADPEIWRGLELTASGGPIVVFSYDALRPDVSGWAFGTYGTGGDGYTEQINEAFSETHHRLIAALEPDVWLEGFAQQGSAPSAMSDFLNIIRNSAADVEVAWIGESTHNNGPPTSWHTYIMDNAAGAGLPAASVIEDPAFGTLQDQAAAGMRKDGAHYSLRGNSLLAEAWLALLAAAATAPGDLDGDGLVGISDLLILLGGWGPCPGSCPPACIGDLNGDCAIDVIDLLTLLANWS